MYPPNGALHLEEEENAIRLQAKQKRLQLLWQEQ